MQELTNEQKQTPKPKSKPKLKLLQIYNQYRSLFNGEETVVFRTAQLVERHGGRARLWMRSSRDMAPGFIGKAKAVLSGIYNWQAAREVTELLDEYQPDIVHAHNLYPLFSPSVLVACRRANVPVVMTLHNQQLTCPRADHLCHGQICDRCLDGSVTNCVLRNCRENLAESIAYAARSAVARHWRLFRDNVTLFIALTDFARQRLVRAGFDVERIAVLPNMAPMTHEPIDPAAGTYVAFAGRLSAEKGLSVLIAAAERAKDIPFKIAGGGPLFNELSQQLPSNVQLLGQLPSQDLTSFYRGARFLVLPSVNYEMCPLVISEAMSHGLPVVASRIGGIPELVDDGRSGLLFQPGDVDDLQAQIQRLWNDARVCRELGHTAWQKATTEFCEDAYYARLMNVYRYAMELTGTPPRISNEREDAELVELSAPMIDQGKHNILGVQISAVDYDAAVQKIITAARARQPLAISALAVHGLMTGALDAVHRFRLNRFDLLVPDGQPVRWALRVLHGVDLPDRVYGPTLMMRVCERAANENLSIYLFGSTADTLRHLTKNLVSRFPALIIAGQRPSRFRQMSLLERDETIQDIRRSGANIVFIGIGCPRQEVWAYEFREAIGVPLLAVGAAFSFHAGQLAQAPAHIQRSGLEWLYRLVHEPRRLWKRYLILNPLYLAMVFAQRLHIGRFDPKNARQPGREMLYG